ncbi:hypothetical protein FOMG_16017 [Fusarium oxysporum f. sp. melonis 26406]|uniref:Uncharacterized protein n=1 Tax=Fusarium oxysporum f. sp. melonis 26406 TaxID=1089452 RepID=W9ZGQ1_FUSOX|nr:hypothetical protein FOMG_16017 [Fusarium oxysporum f. sp. melonis 26406]
MLQAAAEHLTAMFSSVRPPVDAHPMAEMPQWLINAPCCMMEDGAISDSPPEPGTGGSRGLWHELAPRLVPSAGRAGETSDYGSLDVARVTNSLFRGCQDYPPLRRKFLDYFLLALASSVSVGTGMAQTLQKRGKPACRKG